MLTTDDYEEFTIGSNMTLGSKRRQNLNLAMMTTDIFAWFSSQTSTCY